MDKKIFGIVLLVIGIGLIIYGLNHMESTESEIKDFFGKEDTTGMFATGIGALLVVAGGVVSLRK
ncbi:MAG: DUF3185 family protein [Flavobacterium sp.]|uniref:DUF3185 family protein n=1 Tax=Flavobacterium sp. TaxID=239 RepID=UPI00121E39CF|nr:DUF3185 family protein [Flavobacterium sp.]RZJ68194.1 MAG: DUF3185 family protein [Flavobacterium sp.]